MDAQLRPKRSETSERPKSSHCTAQTEASTKPTPLAACDEASAELLHELNNIFVSVLLNTQVMEWKLPSYSRLKRNLHEVQRDAQRGGELVKRLTQRLQRASCRELTTKTAETGTSQASVATYAAASQQAVTAIRPQDPSLSPGQKVPHTPM